MAKKPKKLILVVHGIGEQAAGETLDDLAGAASEKNKAARVQSEVRWLADEHDMGEGRDVELFPCHIRRVSREKSELVFSEVFWARSVTRTIRRPGNSLRAGQGHPGVGPRRA